MLQRYPQQVKCFSQSDFLSSTSVPWGRVCPGAVLDIILARQLLWVLESAFCPKSANDLNNIIMARLGHGCHLIS